LKVPGQLHSHLLALTLVQLLQDLADCLVEVNSLGFIQTVVQISLEQNVPEAVPGQPLTANDHQPAALISDQTMLLVQAPAQLPDHLRFVYSLHPGHHFRRETLTLDTGYL
jgi:hypothetical protein